MSLTQARVAQMHRLGLFADPVEDWKRIALRNATEGGADGSSSTRMRRWWGARWIFARYLERRDTDAHIGGAVVDAEAFLAAGDRKLAAALAANALQVAASPRNRARLWKVVTWSAIAAGSPFAAHEALSRLPPEVIDVHIVAAYLDCCNRVREGVELLERARAGGVRSTETSKLLIDLYHREGDTAAVRTLLTSDSPLLSQRDREAIESALAAPAG